MTITAKEQRDLNGIGRQALAVQSANDAFTVAKENERHAREELLRALLTNIRPALAACSDRVKVGEIKTPEGDSHQSATWVGIRVIGDGPRLKDGKWHGRDLFVRPDCTFVELVYGGTVRGVVDSHWSSAQVDVDVSTVVREFDLSVITSALTAAMVREAGPRRGMRTEQINQQAEQLRALTTILRSWSL